MKKGGSSVEETASNRLQLCTFWIAKRLFGVNILDVKEISTELSVTPIFHAPEEVRGFVNIRGQIHLVLDLKKVLGFDEVESGTNKRLLIFKPSVSEPFGILVDRMGDIHETDESQIERDLFEVKSAGDDYSSLKSGIIIGVCKMKNSLMVLLNPRFFLRSLS